MKRYLLLTIVFMFLLSGCEKEIVDTEAPFFNNMPYDIEIDEGETLDLLELGLTAYDINVDPKVDELIEVTDLIRVDIQDTSVLSIGTHLVTFSVEDASGNIGTQILNIIVNDGTPPVLEVKPECEFVISIGEDLSNIADCFVVTDNGDQNELIEGNFILDTSVLDSSIAGTYTIYIDYADTSGNQIETQEYSVEVITSTALEYFEYELNDTMDSYTIVLYHYTGPKDVVIPSHINFLPVTIIGPRSFKLMELKSVVIPETVTKIGNFAFYSNDLTKITIPEGVTVLGHSVFAKNMLFDVTLPSNLESIDIETFSENNLVNIVFPSTLKTIGAKAFFNNKIEEVIIPEGVTVIGKEAFYINSSTLITLPDSLIHIGEKAFMGHIADSIYIGPNVVEFENVFQSGKRIINDMYEKFHHPFEFIVSSDNPFYTEIDGVLYSKDLTKIVRYGLNEADVDFLIPNTVTVIGPWAFALQRNLNTIVIPTSVIEIRRGAFSGVELTELTIPSSVQVIYDRAFLFSDIYTMYFNIEIPSELWAEAALHNIHVHDFIVNEDNEVYSTIGGVLFQGTTLVKYPTQREDIEYIIPEGTTYLGYRSFSESKIEKLTLPASLESMSSDVLFLYNRYLTEVIVLGDDPLRFNNIWQSTGLPIDLMPQETETTE